MDVGLLVAYIALLGLALGRSRSTAWVVVALAGTGAVAGSLLAFARDRGLALDRSGLQFALLVVLAIVALLAFVPRLGFAGVRPVGSGRRQLAAIWLPVVALIGGFTLMSLAWTEQPAFLRPVSFLIGNGDAEDNAKWLEFAAQFSSGAPIDQGVPLGGPLELLLTGVATALGVASHAVLGGYNEVAVAANTVVLGEFLMVALVLLALAPMVETRIGGRHIPVPAIWTAMIALAAATAVLIGFGHLTLQYAILACVLWSATFLSGISRAAIPRARLLTSLAVAVAMTVWLPLNVVAIVIVLGWLVVLITRALRGSGLDSTGLALTVLVGIGIAQPAWSSLTYSLGVTTAAESIGSAGRGVAAAGRAALSQSPVFAAQGGTEQVGPILALLAVATVVGAVIALEPVAGPLRGSLGRRFVPLGVLLATALAIVAADAWATGDAPHYGSLKFGYLVAVVAAASGLPVALLAVSRGADGMTAGRWVAAAGVIGLLAVDTLLPRAIAFSRPQQWSPPIPFENTSGSYWYPAEVNGTGTQPIASNPIACVYLPQGSPYPTAIVPSGLSDAQRVYACTRQLAGLSGAAVSAQPVVDWVRREWLTNTPAWTDVYDGLAALPPEVLAKPVILLDDGSNVIGIEPLGSLLQRFPKPAPQG